MHLHRQHGFTLIEIMVVLVIMSIAAGFAVISLDFNNVEDTLEEEAKRIAALSQLANDEAILQGRELALQIDDEGYRFLRLEDKTWEVIENDKLLRSRELTEGIQIDLNVEGITNSQAKALGPLIIFYTSGEQTAFELNLIGPNREFEYRLKGDTQGRLVYPNEQS